VDRGPLLHRHLETGAVRVQHGQEVQCAYNTVKKIVQEFTTSGRLAPRPQTGGLSSPPKLRIWELLDERAQAAGLTDADAGIATGVAEMDHDDALEVEGSVVIISATTPSEEPFSYDSEEFRTPDAPTLDEHPLLDPE